MNSLQRSTQRNMDLIQSNELSVYKDKLTTKGVITNVAKIKKAFPALPMGFYEVFDERLKANSFTDERLKDAIANVIDTCPYPTPTIAQFISFDKKIKLNSYEDMVKKTFEFGSEIWNSYKMIKFPEREKPVWIHIDEVNKYNIQ